MSFQTAVSYGAGSCPYAVAVGDFNGDGKLDLAVAGLVSSNNVSVLLGNGDGTFQAAVNYSAGDSPVSVAVGDFNGNGKSDLVVANLYSKNLSVLLGNGDGTFQAAVNYSAGSNPTSVAVGDFNGDGKPDLAAANYGVPWNVSVLLGNGDGTFQTAVNYAAGSYPSSVAVADFNGDGKADLAVTNISNVSVLLGNGDGTFQSAVSYATGPFPQSVAVGDLNVDGKLDLAVANNGGANVSVLLGNGDGTFQAAVNYAAGTQPYSVAVADFNEDNKPDLVVANYSSGNVSVLAGNGDGTFQPATTFVAGSSPSSVAVGDFNRDGTLDVSVANGSQVAILLNSTAVAPLITSANHAAFRVSTGNLFTVIATGTPTPSISETGSLPLGVAFQDNHNGTATLGGTPQAGTTGSYSLTITASNGVGSNATQNFTLTVNQAPAITSANSATFQTGSVGSFTVTTTGFPIPFLGEIGAVPAGVAFVDNGNGTGTLSGTPAGGGVFNISFTAQNGVSPNATQSFTLTVNQAPAITSANSAMFPPATPGSFTVTTAGFPTPSLSRSGMLPTGVTFMDNGDGTGTLSGTPTKAGVFNITFTAQNGVSPNATQNFTLTVGRATTTTTLGSSPNPTVYGQAVTFMATVTATQGIPTGTITFLDGTTSLGSRALDASGQVSVAITRLGAGSHSITGSYSGSSTYAPSTSPVVTQIVNPASTTTALTSNPNPSVLGQAVTLTATVTSSAGAIVAGSVTFWKGTTILGTVNLDPTGQASFVTSTLAVGSHSLTASYKATANFLGSISTAITQVVNKDPTTTTVVSSPNPSNAGQTVTFTATVTSPAAGIPTGTVTFKDESKAIGSGTLNASGQATFSTSKLTPGTHNITAKYGADANFAASTSTVLVQTVN